MEKTPPQQAELLTLEMLSFYKEFSQFTWPGCYIEDIRQLPDDISELAAIIRNQTIPKIVWQGGNRGYNHDKRHGDITTLPWYRQPEDDYFPTAAGIIAELYRRNANGITIDRNPSERLVLSCRYTAVLTASILKAKGIPARVRSGFAPYFRLTMGYSTDHWINQYWSTEEGRWITIDVDALIEDLPIDPLDIPADKFDFAADAWMEARSGKTVEDHFINAGGHGGFTALVEALMFDFHCLMGNEIVYTHFPEYMYGRFRIATKEDLHELDQLARLMQNLDKNYQKLKELWEKEQKFRILKGGLI